MEKQTTSVGQLKASETQDHRVARRKTKTKRVIIFFVGGPIVCATIAQFQVAQSALKLSLVTYQRNQDLFNRRVIAPQDLDTATDTYCENQATAAADEANIDRFYALEAFKLVRAPFDGIVKARDTDIGAYVAAACKPAFATTSSKCAATVVKPFSPNSIPRKRS
jgi:multidrug resistance efflux pump